VSSGCGIKRDRVEINVAGVNNRARAGGQSKE